MCATRKRIFVKGIVQGVGFRPFVYNAACRLGLAGFVSNNVSGVHIELEGKSESISAFEHELSAHAPPLAHITTIRVEPITPVNATKFEIIRSEHDGEKTALIAPDNDVCQECLDEMNDPSDRRYRYPFINCTNCGPRFSIIKGVPYDRPNTTMAKFPMCPDCLDEYENPTDRRYHAQPIACPACGPRLTLLDVDFKVLECDDALTETVKLIDDGRIVAIKGIGGYHLACDALNETAVMDMRQRKHRDEKPFAMMTKDIDTLRLFARVTEREEALLASRQRPIVLVEKISDDMAPGLSPDNKYIGAILPYTPLHHLLLVEVSTNALVMTSANYSDEPIVFTESAAKSDLANVADAFLIHNRAIHNRCDDSIERLMDHGPMILRRSRGYTPFPVGLDREYPSVLAVGGEMKNTFCFIKGDRAFLSQHIGDMKYETVFDSFKSWVERFHELLDIKDLGAIAYDKHPNYMTTGWAKEHACKEKIAVQHHHAHMAACMTENHAKGEGIGIIFDGTGYGDDGSIWGGEFLYGDAKEYERAGTIKPLALPGGDKAIKEPYRIALGLMFDIYGDTPPDLPAQWYRDISPTNKRVIKQMIDKGINTPYSHGMGRLFDAVSALIGLCPTVSFEGQAAITLEMIAQNGVADSYPFDMTFVDGMYTLDFSQAIRRLVADFIARAPSSLISAKFHNAVALGAVEMAKMIRDGNGVNNVFLSGGVFQNRYLSDKIGAMLQSNEFEVYRHARVPPNDGGISLGQAIVAANKLI